MTGNAKQDATRDMVLAFGLDTIIIAADRPKDAAASRYLDNTANTRGKPAIAVEAGYAGTTETDDIEVLANGCFNVMRYLKMLPGSVTPVENPAWIEKVENVTSDTNGIFYPLVKRGATSRRARSSATSPITPARRYSNARAGVGRRPLRLRGPVDDEGRDDRQHRRGGETAAAMNMRGFAAALIVATACMQTTPPSHGHAACGFRPAALVAADFNGDGLTDVAITGESERLPYSPG